MMISVSKFCKIKEKTVKMKKSEIKIKENGEKSEACNSGFLRFYQ